MNNTGAKSGIDLLLSLLEIVSSGRAKKVQNTVSLDGLTYNATIYSLEGMIRIDLKPA